MCSCDPSFIDVFTELNTDYSGTRTVGIAVRTEYIQKGSVILSENKSLFDGILNALPEGEVETFEESGYTHFTSKVEFEDVNFLKHISIDDFAETPPERFYAHMEKKDYFFYSEFFFDDYVDMKIDETLLISGDPNSDHNRLHDLATADEEILVVTYQIKCPVKIIDSNADLIGDDNIAIWNIKYGEQRNIRLHGKKTKFLSYFLVVVLGLIGLFVIFIIFALMFSSRRKRPGDTSKKPYYSYDNYFKRDRYFSPGEDDEP
ncbi:MAG: hypothetical protein JW770_01690 [Actinobacteria bacterium]|nr:hypothetical protein [Actinomycetota bacterium]